MPIYSASNSLLGMNSFFGENRLQDLTLTSPVTFNFEFCGIHTGVLTEIDTLLNMFPADTVVNPVNLIDL